MNTVSQIHAKAEVKDTIDLRSTFCGTVLEDYKCRQCRFKVNMKIILKNHTTFYHQRRGLNSISNQRIKCFRCQNCSFQTYSLLILMKRAKNGGITPHTVNFQCDDCSEKAKRSKVQWFRCEGCCYKTMDKDYLKQHILMKHKPNFASTDPVELKSTFCWAVPEDYQCRHCQFKTNMKIILKNHTNFYHKGKGLKSISQQEIRCFKCHNCSFQTYSLLVLMKQAKNGGNAKRFLCFNCASKADWFKCGRCSFRTAYKTTLQNHASLRHTD